MPALLLNHLYPFSEIYVPVDGSWRKFRGGKLEISEDDPAYEIVLAAATADPHTEIHYTEAATADAPAKPSRRVKKQAEFSCDACRPAQVFDSQQELADHIKVIHMALPKMDAEGNELGRRDEEEVAPTSIPAASPRK